MDYDGTLVPFSSEMLIAVWGLLRHTGSWLVLSTAWAWKNSENPEECYLYATAPIGDLSGFLHEDWRCARFSESIAADASRTARRLEIAEWLGRHSEVTHWVAFDDAPVDAPGGILCSKGLTRSHIDTAYKLLGGDPMPPLPKMNVDYGPFPSEPNIRIKGRPTNSEASGERP